MITQLLDEPYFNKLPVQSLWDKTGAVKIESLIMPVLLKINTENIDLDLIFEEHALEIETELLYKLRIDQMFTESRILLMDNTFNSLSLEKKCEVTFIPNYVYDRNVAFLLREILSLRQKKGVRLD